MFLMPGSRAIKRTVHALNTITGRLTLKSGTGTSVTTSSQTITIANTGVTSITVSSTGYGIINGGTVTTTGTIAPSVSLTSFTNSISSDIVISSGAYTDGPSVAQGTAGTWVAFGTIICQNPASATNHYSSKLWDGTTVMDSARTTQITAGVESLIALSGVITSPAGNIRISVTNADNSSALIKASLSGNSKDSTVTVARIV